MGANSNIPFYDYRIFGFVILAGMAVALCFDIVAVSLHNLYSAYLLPDGDFTGGEIHFGAFTTCADIEGVSPMGVFFSRHSCQTISSNCGWSTNYVEDGVTKTMTFYPANWNCSQFNAFRSFFVISVIMISFGIITGMFQLVYRPDVTGDGRLWVLLTEFFGWFAVLSLIISFSLVAAHVSTIDLNNVWGKGSAWALQVSAFCIQTVAMIIYTAVVVIEGRSGGGEGSWTAFDKSKGGKNTSSDGDTIQATPEAPEGNTEEAETQ